MYLDIIIPVLNEEKNLPRLLDHLLSCGTPSKAIIVVDGGSSDNTRELAKDRNILVIQAPKKGRATQMNFGAKLSAAEWLYFIHADTLPPKTFYQDISLAIEEDFLSGCFRYQFDQLTSIFLKVNAFFTRFNKLWCRGGDQTLFVQKKLFDELGGFVEDYIIMEDFDFIKKLQEKSSFKIIPKNVIVSSRKYQENSYLRVQIANFIVFNMYRRGMDQEKMMKTYQKLLKLPTE